jgi:Tol biopolymer transport system component
MKIGYYICLIGLILCGCAGLSIREDTDVFTESLTEPLEGKVVLTKPGEENQLYTMNADGSNYHAVPNSLFEGKKIKDPRWSPDGKKIVFTVGPYKKGNKWINKIYIINEDGTECKEIYEGGRDPSFSPNGKEIIFLKRDSDIYTIRVDGSELRQLTNDAEKEEETGVHFFRINPCWSPDGKKILFWGCKKHIETSEWETSNIFIMNADGTDLKQIISDDAIEISFDSTPRWSPSGDQIAFIGIKGRNSTGIYIINSEGTNLRKINPEEKGGYKETCWSSDGRKIMYIYYVSTDWPFLLWEDMVELRVRDIDERKERVIMKLKGEHHTITFDFDWWTPIKQGE